MLCNLQEFLLTKSSKPISEATTLKIVGTGAFMLHGFAAAIKGMAKEGLILSVKCNPVWLSARILVVDAVLRKRWMNGR